MNRIIITILCMLAFSSCVKSKLEVTYNSQESKIESYIASKGDTYRSIRNGGANRLVLKEGEGEELQRNGFVSFYYAGYKFSGSFSAANLFVTNHQATAEQSGWNLTDADYQIYEINLADAKLVQGLKDGLLGVKAGEECEILFSGKYGFGDEKFGIIPANSALLYKIWVVGVAND
jgi:FKBP-type peptidyl-prolyl cis-trans isomerase